jgi:hypothetical protein
MEKLSHKYWWIRMKPQGSKTALLESRTGHQALLPQRPLEILLLYFSFQYRAAVASDSLSLEEKQGTAQYVAYAIGGAVAFHYDLFPPCLGCTFCFAIVYLYGTELPQMESFSNRRNSSVLARSSL